MEASPSPLSSRPERSVVEGPGVQPTFTGNVFRPERPGFPTAQRQPTATCTAFRKVVHRRDRPAGYETGHFLSSAAQQIPGCPILRAFCEGWDTTNLDTDRRVSHPLPRAQRTPDSCHAALDKTACVPFSMERRMKFVEPSKLNRNPGDGAPAFWWCFLPCQTPTGA
jgi:hypothetical protein